MPVGLPRGEGAGAGGARPCRGHLLIFFLVTLPAKPSIHTIWEGVKGGEEKKKKERKTCKVWDVERRSRGAQARRTTTPGRGREGEPMGKP